MKRQNTNRIAKLKSEGIMYTDEDLLQSTANSYDDLYKSGNVSNNNINNYPKAIM